MSKQPDSMKIVQRKTEELIPYERNQKVHDEKQILNVANSIRRFGWKQPIVVDAKDVIIIGHCRWEAAKSLGLETVPVVVADNLTEDEVRELRIVDNKTNESPWDFEALKIDMDELSFDGFDFDMSDLVTAPPSTTNEKDHVNKEKDEKTEQLINDAWREHAAQFAQQYDILSKHGYSFSGITKALAKIKFIESKYYGKEYPRYLSLAFHKNQFITNGDNISAYDGLINVSDGTIKAERLRFVTGDDITKIVKGSLSFAGARMPLDFPASLARELITEFSHNGKVLDPCHGWGGCLCPSAGGVLLTCP